MSQIISVIPLKQLLNRRKDEINIQEFETYKRITIRTNGQGIQIRDLAIGSDIGTKRQFIARSGQFILSKIDARNGAFGTVPSDCDGAIITGNFWTFDLNHQILESGYFDWLTKTPLFIDFCINASDGTTNRVYLQESKFLSMEIALPSLEEQRRIVGRIEELAGKIAEARGLRDRSIQECGLLLKSSVKSIIYNESTKQNLKSLKDLVTIKGGGTPSKQNPMFWRGSIPWISAKDIKKREIYNSIDYISEDALNNSSAKIIEAGAVIVVVRGMILAHTFPSTILRIPATINQDLKALIPGKQILSEYLSHVLWALNDSILELVAKSTHDTRKLETPKLLNFEIPVPPLAEQHRIVEYLDELQAKVDKMKRLRQESLKELDALLPAILDKAFKGEL